jgi:isoleucyl-tRNA synthetase
MNYKETLNLPKTEFPMKANLINREPEILARWEKENLYGQIQEARADRPAFVLHDGPPFANGDVHMGTALNKILKDFIVKSRSMDGFRAPYIPGWDCHGLPIEFKVVKESKGLSPLEVRKKSEAYARKYIDIQRRQFRRLGVLGDWDHPYLTLDPGYEAEILRVFARLVENDLVYQSRKPVFWSTGAQTALAEAEVEYREKTDPSIYVAFPIKEGPLAGVASIAIWTTTPWTLPANVAIAVNPEFKYVAQKFVHPEQTGTVTLVLASDLISSFTVETGWKPEGKPIREFKGSEMETWIAQHPFLDRNSVVLVGDHVTLEAGTGAVHTAPGHGDDDYLVGIKHRLPLISPVDDNGLYTDEVGVPEWVGKYVFAANKDVVERLRSVDALLAIKDYVHSYPHCWRSKTPIIFRAVEQFFIRIDKIKESALAAIDRVDWVPEWGRNRIYATVESRPDWCISRQRSWGVPLPVFYENGKPRLEPDWIRKVADLIEKRGSNVWYDLSDQELAAELNLAPTFTRRNDTLDVWIDSGTSHQAVLRKHPALHWPADVYVEATDQHRGWFQSSLLTSVAICGEAPYKEVITHAFVVDLESRLKVSKSQQGTYSKPTDSDHFVNKFGADIVRLWVSSVNYTDEVPFGEKMFDQLADTYRRIRNTLRILLVDLSSLYIDITKDRMYCDRPSSAKRRAAQSVMYEVFDGVVRLIAPILAYTADEAWGHFGKAASVHLEQFPDSDPSRIDENALADAEALLAARAIVAQAIEPARQQKLIGNGLEAHVDLVLPAENRLHTLDIETIEEFLISSQIDLASGDEPKATVAKTSQHRCDRCWRHKRTVGIQPEHPTLCDRCAEVVSELATKE